LANFAGLPHHILYVIFDFFIFVTDLLPAGKP